MFKSQIPKILINRVSPFEKEIEPGTVRHGIGRVGIDEKNENDGRRGQQNAGKRDCRASHRNPFRAALVQATRETRFLVRPPRSSASGLEPFE